MATLPSTRATASTLYSVGSTTKAFTAAAVSLLVDEGKLKWDTPISELIKDDFVLQDSYETTHTTIEDALSHRTGVPSHDLAHGGPGSHTAAEMTRSMRHLPRAAELRTSFIYCNAMYVVVSHVIESLSNSWIGDFFKTRIMDVTGMSSTYFSTEAAQQADQHLSQGYYWDENTRKYVEVPDRDQSEASGAGMLTSNVLDFAKWIRTMMNKTGPMSLAGHDALLTPRIHRPSPPGPSPYTGPTSYCLGWETGVYHDVQFFSHTGGVQSYSANVVWLPSHGFGVVAFGNTAVTAKFAEDVLIWHLIDEKLGLAKAQRFNWNKK